MNYSALITAAAALSLISSCALQPFNTSKTKSAIPPAAPVMDSVSDDPIVTAQPTIKRAEPVKAIKALTKGDDIDVLAPVPVLSATMPEEPDTQ